MSMNAVRDRLLSPEFLRQSGVIGVASQCGILPSGYGSQSSVEVDQLRVSAKILQTAELVSKEAQNVGQKVRQRLSESNKRKSPQNSTGDDEEPVSPSADSHRRTSRRTNKGTEQPPPSGRAANKGLRHFATKVLELVEAKGRTNYHEVGDELVRELIQNNDGSEGQYDEKNIRRRVYDAINVLKAMDIIGQGSARELCWQGWPDGAGGALEPLQAKKKRLLQSLKKQLEQLEKMENYRQAVTYLIQRNQQNIPEGRSQDDSTDPGAKPGSIPYPFVLLQAYKHTTVKILHSDDRREYFLDFGRDLFSIQDGLECIVPYLQQQSREAEQREHASLLLPPHETAGTVSAHIDAGGNVSSDMHSGQAHHSHVLQHTPVHQHPTTPPPVVSQQVPVSFTNGYLPQTQDMSSVHRSSSFPHMHDLRQVVDGGNNQDPHMFLQGNPGHPGLVIQQHMQHLPQHHAVATQQQQQIQHHLPHASMQMYQQHNLQGLGQPRHATLDHMVKQEPGIHAHGVGHVQLSGQHVLKNGFDLSSGGVPQSIESTQTLQFAAWNHFDQ